MSEKTVVKNEGAKRYEIEIDGDLAVIEYMPAGSSVVLSHTEVPEALEGQGLGGQLVRFALNDLKENGKKVIPTCPFVLQYIKNHPEWQDLVFGAKKS